MAVADPERQIEWEARQRPRAAIAAALGAVLVLAGQVGRGFALNGRPDPGELESLARLERPGPIGPLPSVQVPLARFYLDHFPAILITTILVALGYVALAYALTFLAAATRARRPELLKAALYLPAIGGVLWAVALVTDEVGAHANYSKLLAGPATTDHVIEIGYGNIRIVGALLYLPAGLALGLSFVLISLNAMRAGLLKRFMGVLGAVVGGLLVLGILKPQLAPIPIVQTIWLVILSVLLVGRGEDYPAWRTGRAEPWPEAERRKPRRATEPAPAAAAAIPAPTRPPADKRKRKRRK